MSFSFDDGSAFDNPDFGHSIAEFEEAAIAFLEEFGSITQKR